MGTFPLLVKQLAALRGLAKPELGNGNLPKIVITGPEAMGEIYLHGAQVTSWIPDGQSEVLFMSDRSNFSADSPIRGGVPICLPWFGPKQHDPTAPSHGVARLSEWKFQRVGLSRDGATVTMGLEVKNDERFDGEFKATYIVTFGAELKLELTVQNTGHSEFTFEEALHTYYRVRDVTMVRICGLEGRDYIDKTDNGARKKQDGEIAITCETDRVYIDQTTAVVLDDPSIGRKLAIEGMNAHNVVVWNPWVEKAEALKDFGDDEWKNMICLEMGNVADKAITLAARGSHTITVVTRERS